MPTASFVARLAAAAAIALAPAAAHAHATYNISGYGADRAGSTNGADGSPTDANASWTNGATDYAGALPVNWYCGLHAATQVRTIQTGLGDNPPSGSLLAQINAYNTANDPDLPTDRVLAVGGLSWTDPSNGDQGWGHGLDYGIIDITPLADIQQAAPVRLTITLADDPSDGVATRLAYAIYGGWDTSSGATRHQTFTTNPSPVNNPLGSSGLTLVDFAVATAPGTTLSRSYDLDPVYNGKYTVFVAALGGVAGQYQLTAGLYPVGVLNEQLTQCQTDLTTRTTDLNAANAQIQTMTQDTDGDEVSDQRDTCSQTPTGQFVDAAGCSQAQFCSALPATTKADRAACKKADWKNDEPAMTPKQADCTFDKSTKACGPKS
jgi:hypothetical protein